MPTPTPRLVALGRTLPVVCALVVSLFLATFVSAAESKKTYSINSGPAATTLKQFAEQSGRSVLFSTEKVQGISTNAIRGELTAEEALDRLLSGTRLSAVPEKSTGGFAIRREVSVEVAEKNDSSRPANRRAADEVQDGVVKLDTFEVFGRKTLNMDIQRTRDDAQPYVVFTREQVEQSAASNLEEFLKNRLTMNTSQTSSAQFAATTTGNQSSINLRGLGSNQTLILVDGRRMPGVFQFGAGGMEQPDLNGIPLAAVERIDVLPSTASGIYGGGATGGVVNIILRRDYAGAQVKLTYDNTFETDSARRRVDFSAGFNLEQGRTNVLVSASYSDANSLLVRDRDFAKRGRALQLANNPAALFGSPVPPLGATSNIRSTTGANLVLKDGTPLNSPITFVPAGYPGITSDGGAALVANAGHYNLGLPMIDQEGGGQSLVSSPTTKALAASTRRRFSSRVEAFLDYSRNENRGQTAFASKTDSVTLQSNAPNNPFTSAIRVRFPSPSFSGTNRTEVVSERAVGGVTIKLVAGWMAELDYTWSRSRNAISFPFLDAGRSLPSTVFSSGALDVVRDTTVYPLDLSSYPYLSLIEGPFSNALENAVLRFAGPLNLLPAGAITLSGLLEYRQESISDGFEQMPVNGAITSSLYPHRNLTADSAYLEARIPLIAAHQNIVGVRELELQVSGRHDEYVTRTASNLVAVGSVSPITRVTNKARSTDALIGLRYSPMPDVVLRASYGTGFLPPGLQQLLPRSQSAVSSALDPRRGNTSTPTSGISITAGGNPDLRPEKSESLSAGLVLTSSVVPGLRLSIDFTEIRKTDEISTLSTQQLFDNESSFPGRISRGANLPSDLPGWAGPVTAVDITLANISLSKVQAFDAQLDFEKETAIAGTFALSGIATWQTHFQRQIVPGSGLIESIGHTGAPLEFKANLGLIWKYRRWTAGWTVRYFDSYRVHTATASAATITTAILNQGSDTIASQVYHDFFASHRFGISARSPTMRQTLSSRLLSGTEITAGIRNLFNTSPPILALAASATGGYSTYGDPRLASYYVSVKRSF